MCLNNVKEKLGQKKYNVLLVFLLWFLFIAIHYIFWNQLINSFDSTFLLYAYILFAPVLLSVFIYKIAEIKNKQNKKSIVVFGIIMPLLIYYICIGLFFYLAMQVFSNSSFPSF